MICAIAMLWIQKRSKRLYECVEATSPIGELNCNNSSFEPLIFQCCDYEQRPNKYKKCHFLISHSNKSVYLLTLLFNLQIHVNGLYRACFVNVPKNIGKSCFSFCFFFFALVLSSPFCFKCTLIVH